MGVDINDPREDASVTQMLRNRNLRWWHWTRGMWLVVTDDRTVTARTLADSLNADPRLPNHGVFVLDADDPRSFAGYVPTDDPPAALRFLREEWAGKVSAPAAAPAFTP